MMHPDAKHGQRWLFRRLCVEVAGCPAFGAWRPYGGGYTNVYLASQATIYPNNECDKYRMNKRYSIRPERRDTIPTGRVPFDCPALSGRYGMIAFVMLMVFLLFGDRGRLAAQDAPAVQAWQAAHTPQTVQYFIQQGLQHYEQNRYDDAIRNFEIALQYPEPPREVYVYIISSHLLARNYRQAIRMADQGLDEHPGFVRLKVMKGEALIQTDITKAVSVFEEVWEAIESGETDQLDGIRKGDVRRYISRLYQQIAAGAFGEGDYGSAAGYYEKARSMDVTDAGNHTYLAYSLIQLNEWERAEEAVKEGLRRFPESEDLLLMQAQVHEHYENQDELLNTLEALYRSDPANMDRAVWYGRALLGANRADQANTFFRDKIQTYPDERILYETLLDINRQRFHQSGILEVLRLQMAHFPSDVELEEQYGRELLSARNFEEAHAWFDSLAVAYGEPEFGRLAAHAWLFAEDYDKAEHAYRMQLERWPDHTVMMGEMGRVLVRNGKDDEAREMLRLVLQKRDNHELRYLYGTLAAAGPDRMGILEPLMGTIYEGRARWLLIEGSDKGLLLEDSENGKQHDDGDQGLLIDENENGLLHDGSDRQRLRTGESDLSAILINMLGFVEQRQKEVRVDAQAGLESLNSAAPPLFQTATELKQVGAEVRELLGDVRAHLSFKASLNVINKALAVYPESALLLHHKGVLYFEHGETGPAKRFLLEAAEREVNRQDTHYALGEVYKELDDFDQAVLSFERVLALDPENRPAYRSLIRIHHQHGAMEQLGNRWLQRYQHHKGNIVLREFLVEVLHRADRFEEARAVLE